MKRRRAVESSPYQDHGLLNPIVTEVRPDQRRHFLVVCGTRSATGRPWTLVLERENDYWISRRELDGLYAPADAVSGFLFNREGYQDPVDLLRRMNEIIRTEYYGILQEKIRAEQARIELAQELSRANDLIGLLRLRLRLGRFDEGPGRRASGQKASRRRRTR
jgi:hypothetical protein